VFDVHQVSVHEFVEAGTRVLQVSATDAECPNSSCIIYSMEPADDHNSAFTIDSQTGSSLIFISQSVGFQRLMIIQLFAIASSVR